MTGPAPARGRSRGLQWTRRQAGRLLRCTAGVSAIEFALLAPVLILGAFATVDVGRAIYERMMIGQSLRAAAQLAMQGADANQVHDVLREVASENFVISVDGSIQEGPLSTSVQPDCACPGETFVQLDCTSVCDSGIGARKFYRLSASKTFQAVLLPDFGLGGSVAVMAR